MTSSAISAQGSVLSIATGSGGAKTITGVTLGNPTIVTATTHGFNVGDVVVIASVGGATTVNGTFSVIAKTANTFAIKLDTTGGSSYTSGGTATPNTYTTIGNCKSFSGFDGSASELDRTNLASSAKEYILGLVDYGNMTIEYDFDNSDAGQIALQSKFDSGILTAFRLVLPSSVATANFTAYVKKLPVSGGVDQIVRRQGVDLRISGAVTWS